MLDKVNFYRFCPHISFCLFKDIMFFLNKFNTVVILCPDGVNMLNMCQIFCYKFVNTIIFHPIDVGYHGGATQCPIQWKCLLLVKRCGVNRKLHKTDLSTYLVN